MSDFREAAGKLNTLVGKMQRAVTRYLEPQGISKLSLIDELLILLDGPEQREAQAAFLEACRNSRRVTPAPPVVVDGRKETLADLQTAPEPRLHQWRVSSALSEQCPRCWCVRQKVSDGGRWYFWPSRSMEPMDEEPPCLATQTKN